MNLEPLGAICVQLNLQGETIATLIRAQQENTAKLVRSHLGLLQKAFERVGLNVRRLEAVQDRFEQSSLIPRKLSLLSEKA
jgi:hypothetical protein